MTIAEPENLTKETTTDGKLIFEPAYAGFLRSEGYSIEEFADIDTVESGTTDKTYLVAEIETFDKPKDHPQLDFVADRVTVRICTCWSWRNQSADLSSGGRPTQCGSCKHLHAWNRAERAQQDEQQTKL